MKNLLVSLLIGAGLLTLTTSCKKDDETTPKIEPVINSFSPVQGRPGTIVIIEGQNFNESVDENIVKFNGRNATILESSSTQITVAVPDNATSGKVSVSVNETTTTSTTNFAIVNESTLVNLSLDATTTASSTYSGYSTAYVNDGAPDTDDHKKSWTNYGVVSATNPQWVQLTFDGSKKFSRVEIYTPEGHEIKIFEIQYWNGADWVTTSSIDDNTSANCTIYFHEVESAQIRLLAIRGSDYQPGYARVTEFEVWNY